MMIKVMRARSEWRTKMMMSGDRGGVAASLLAAVAAVQSEYL